MPENTPADHAVSVPCGKVPKIWWTRLRKWNKENPPWQWRKNRAGSLTLVKGWARQTKETKMPWFVYMLRCTDNSLYCGTTTDLDRRVEEHSAGTGARYTRSRLPVQMVWSAQTQSKSEALREEFRIKRLQKHEKELLVTCQTGGELQYRNPIGGISMTKAELVAKLAEEAKVTKKVAAAMLGSLVKTLQTGLKDSGKIRIGGLGTFVVVDRKARMGVNPQTKAKIKIPATKAPAFRAAKALKEAVKVVPKKAGKKGK